MSSLNTDKNYQKGVKGFTKIEQINLNYELIIEQTQQLKDLINMTPFAWKFTPEKFKKLYTQNKWNIECDFNIEVFQKN